MYLDHNAGGRVRPEVAAVLADWLRTPAGNPSSLHSAGRRTRAAIEEARASVARLVGAQPADVVFTSGGTEANNLAVRGLARSGDGIVSNAAEHASVLASAEAAQRQGAVVTMLSPGADGVLTPSVVADAVGPETAVVSIGWANGEIGAVQPIAEIVAAVRETNPNARVHSDAVQAVSQLPVDVAAADVDLLSISGHKLGAPAGIGALVLRRDVTPEALLVGGPQERERRAGTENAAGIVAFGCAARLALEEREAYATRVRAIKESVWALVSGAAAPIERFGTADGLPGTLAVAFPGLRGDALAVALDLQGVAVSTGSACAAAAPEPSHVLRAIGCDDDVALGALRLSFGPELERADAEAAARIVVDVVCAARDKRAARAAGAHDAA